jgi:putative transposase
MTKKRRRHTPEQIVKKLRDAEAMKNAGKELSVVLQTLEISEATYHRWQNQYGGMKASEAKRLKELEDQNRKLKEIVADQQLDIKMLKHLQEGNW